MLRKGTNNPERVWLVGGSEGIGLAMVKKLLLRQGRVVASARHAQTHPPLIELKRQYPKALVLLDCDVTQPESLPEAVSAAWEAFGGLDAWIYNVGTYHPMPIESWDVKSFEAMNQTNYLGAVRLMTELAPKFLAKQQPYKGQWVWNVSLASYFGLPYGGGYSAPKAALMNLAESLQAELSQQGIALKVVNHGFVKTRLTAKNDFPMLGLMEADEAAEKIVSALENKSFETRFPFSLAAILQTLKCLPKSAALSITKRMVKK